MVRLTFNETIYEFRGFYSANGNELHLYRDGKLIYTQNMHVDMIKLNLLTFDRCVDIIKKLNP